jgi:hypothetical protein
MLGDQIANGDPAPPGTVVAFGLEGGVLAPPHAHARPDPRTLRGHRLASRERSA